MKTKNLLFTFLPVIMAVVIFTNCSKSSNTDCDQYFIDKMKKNPSMCLTSLNKGIYEGQVVYFTMVVDPACLMTPNIKPLVVNCAGDTIDTGGYKNVNNITTIYTSTK